MIQVDKLDNYLWGIIEKGLVDPNTIRKIFADDQRVEGEVTDFDKEEAEISKTLSKVEEEVKQVWAEQTENNLPIAWVAPKLKELNVKRGSLLENLSQIRKQRASLLVGLEESASVTAALAGIRARINKGISREDKYAVVREIVKGGIITTTGEGKQRMAHVKMVLSWGEAITNGMSPKLPQDWYCGSLGYTESVFVQAP
jgi:hypothetical protein